MKIEKFILIAVLVFIYSCRNNNNFITEPNNFGSPQLHALADSIPYDKLGSGKIVFYREYDEMYVIDVNNKKSWVIEQSGFDPQISPEGDRITFSGGHSVCLTDIYGKNFKQIAKLPEDEQVLCPTWLPDNKRIIYAVYFPVAWYLPSPVSVSISDIQTSIAENVLDDDKLLNGYPIDIVSVSNKDVCIMSTFDKGICSFSLNGDNFKQIIKNSASYTYTYFCPTWNPAGNKIAVMAIKFATASKPSTEMNIILFNQDGSDSTNIFTSQVYPADLYNGGNNYSLCWSPDGLKILFNKRDDIFTKHIYMINADGSNLTKVTSLPKAADISLSWGK